MVKSITRRSPIQKQMSSALVEQKKFLSSVVPNFESRSAQDQQLAALSSVLLSRANYARRLGKTYGGDRDIYSALGFSLSLGFTDYYNRYQRQDIASKIVNALPDACWRKPPMIVDDEEDEEQSDFEREVQNIIRNLRLNHYFKRVDRISGIGTYGVLYLGFSDVKRSEDLKNEVTKISANNGGPSSTRLLYVRPFNESHAVISEWDNDVTSERYGLPKTYRLKMNVSAITGKLGTSATTDIEVHWSRVIHVAEDLEEDDVYGTPRLKNVFNDLESLELVAGGSAEMFWRGAFPGMSFNLDPEMHITDAQKTELADQIEDYIHGLNRYMRLKGIEVKELAAQITDPTGHVDVLVSLIAAAKGIPKRILMGSERGELASSQDERQWSRRVDERRKDHVEYSIIRPFLSRLVDCGCLPEPKDGEYSIVWPDIDVPTDKELAETNRSKIEMVKTYLVNGIDALIPQEIFLQRFLGATKKEAEDWITEAQRQLDEEDEEIEQEGNFPFDDGEEDVEEQ